MRTPDLETDPRLDALLALHLDALLNAPDAAQALRAQTSDSSLSDLMSLAERLSFTLQPVTPSAEFVERLRSEFIFKAPPALLARWRKLPGWDKLPPRYQTAAKVGGATLTAGLMLFAVRRAWTGQRARHRTATVDSTMRLPSAS
ncbi:MAG: hypothetical protein ACYDBJ_18090 [Aggregatilineales bacterium]